MNVVQPLYLKESAMNKKVTTKEEILEHALDIAMREGVEKVSVRKLAAECNIAIGSMYNYYPDKQTLMTAVSENFWSIILKNQEQLYRPGMGFTLFLGQYYAFLSGRLQQYDNSWFGAMDDKTRVETTAFLKRILEMDDRIIASIWNMDLNPDSFCEYVLTNILALLRVGEKNCRLFIFLLEHLLYNS